MKAKIDWAELSVAVFIGLVIFFFMVTANG